MNFRKVTISEECMKWLEKSKTTEGMIPEDAEKAFGRRCTEIQEDVLRALITESTEPASPDGKAEVVIEIKLVQTELEQVMKVVTNVYAVVYMYHNRKYYVMLDENGSPKKVYNMGNDIFPNIFKKGEYVEKLTPVKHCKYCISMWKERVPCEPRGLFLFWGCID